MVPKMIENYKDQLNNQLYSADNEVEEKNELMNKLTKIVDFYDCLKDN